MNSVSKRYLRRVYRLLLVFGFDVRKFLFSIKGSFLYVKGFLEFISAQSKSEHQFKKIKFDPVLDDWYDLAGKAKGHYFHQDLIIAQSIYENNPNKHIDVGSRIDGFVAHVASFREINVVDIRPLSSKHKAINFIQLDLMSELNDSFNECCDSLSCLHALEHFGVGRYGDPIAYDGYLKGLENLTKMVKCNGKLYLSVPIGEECINFNAHRVFSLGYILGLLANNFVLDKFSYVDDSGDLHEDISISDKDKRDSFDCEYGCGIFELTKQLL